MSDKVVDNIEELTSLVKQTPIKYKTDPNLSASKEGLAKSLAELREKLPTIEDEKEKNIAMSLIGLGEILLEKE